MNAPPPRTVPTTRLPAPPTADDNFASRSETRSAPNDAKSRNHGSERERADPVRVDPVGAGRRNLETAASEGASGFGRCHLLFQRLRKVPPTFWGPLLEIAASEGATSGFGRCHPLFGAFRLVPGPKRMQNLRASRETEWMAKLPTRDDSAWLIGQPGAEGDDSLCDGDGREHPPGSRLGSRLPCRMHPEGSSGPLPAIGQSRGGQKTNKKRPREGRRCFRMVPKRAKNGRYRTRICDLHDVNVAL